MSEEVPNRTFQHGDVVPTLIVKLRFRQESR